MQKKSLFRWIRISITAVLIAFVLHRADLFTRAGWQNLFGTFTQISLPYLAISIAVGFLLMFVSAFKWYMLLRSRSIHVSVWRLYAYYIVGMFFNLLLPTTVGGDVVRMTELGRHTGNYADAVASVFVERFTGLATLSALALIAVVVNVQMFNIPWVTVGLGVMIVGISGVIWFVIDERLLHFAQRILGSRLPLLGTFFAKLEKFQQAVVAYKSDPVALVTTIFISLLFYLLAVVNVWVSALAFGSDLSFIDMLVAVPVILTIMNLPISVGGIGLMEFAYTVTLELFGASSALAISTALLIRAKSFLYAGIGGFIYLALNDGYLKRQEVAGEGID